MMASTQNKTDDALYYESLKQILEIVKYKDTSKNDIGKENVEPWMIGKEVKAVFLEEDAEIIQISCCKSLKISSRGKTKKLYAFLLGEYNLVAGTHTKPIYKKTGLMHLYLFQPVPSRAGVVYSWGVSHTPEARWGYVRSGRAAACPGMAGQWKVYDENSKRWTRDMTLFVKCKP